MDMNRTSKLIAILSLASWLSAGKDLFNDAGAHYKRRRSVERRRPKGASSEPLCCCRCGYQGSDSLKVAWESVKKINGIKVKTKLYIHEECGHG